MNGNEQKGMASWVELVAARAGRYGDGRGYRFLGPGSDADTSETAVAPDPAPMSELTFGRLAVRARAIGAALKEAGFAGERALLLYPPGLAFVEAFFGCLFGGVVAVPVALPASERGMPRLRAIAADARPALVLTTASVLPRFADAAGLLGPGVGYLATDAVPDAAGAGWSDPRSAENSPAFLQYTSGSTADPKGVEVSHGNLLHNEAMIHRAFGQSEASVVVGWLPLHHDMGLIGNVLQPLYAGASAVLMSPVSFLQRPLRWLRAIARYGATTSGGPNFAYDLCVRKIAPQERAGLDLSSWQVAFSGAEPVRAATLERFAAAFAPCGFRAESFYPCYGLAEATLFAAGGPFGRRPQVAAFDLDRLAGGHAVPAASPACPQARLVSCGGTWGEERLEIVDPDSREPCAEGRVGEIWLSGANVAGGYWRQPEASAETFRARLAGDAGPPGRPFLRTGDLGFVHQGELYVTGRLKDLIILRGRNLYPQDVELAAEQSHPALRPGGSAAFAIDAGGEERLVVAAELERRAEAGPGEVMQAIRQAVARQLEAAVWDLLLLPVGALPKTTSGKVRRRACRASYLAGSLPVIERSRAADLAAGLPAEQAAEDPAGLPSRDALLALAAAPRRAELEGYLRRLAAQVLRLQPAEVAAGRELSALGLDSLQAAELRHAVETDLGVALPLATWIEGRSPAALAAEVDLLLAGPLPALGGPVAGAGDEEIPLSLGQRALWFLDRLDPEGAGYVIAGAGRLVGNAGEIDRDALRRAFDGLAARHPLLRATLPSGEPGDEPRLLIHPALPGGFREIDAVEWSAEELAGRLRWDAYRPFDLAAEAPWRAMLYERRDGPLLLLSVHHVVADLGSFEVMLRDLGALYRGASLPAPAACYGDFVRWQRGWLASAAGEEEWRFWQQELAGELEPLDLPLDRARPRGATWDGAVEVLPLAAELSAGLARLAREQKATLFMVALAAFQALLHRWTGQEDLLVGVPTSGRRTAGLAGVVGYFVNPVVLRGRVSSRPGAETPVGELLSAARRTALQAFQHQDFPFALLAERLQPRRVPALSPIFQVMLQLQRPARAGEEGLPAFASGQAGARLDLGGLAIESVALEQRAQFDWTLFLAEDAGGLKAVSLVNRALFDASTSRRLVEQFQVLASALAAGTVGGLALPVADLPFLAAGERHQLLAEWSASPLPPSVAAAELLHELFLRQAERTPDAPALLVEGRAVSYRDLAARADRLARCLRRLGVGPEEVVAICLDRSAEMAAAVLAVLRVGGAYLPLDPRSPRERLTSMLADSRARVVLTVRRWATLLGDSGPRILWLDGALAELDGELLPPSAAKPENRAYVIYTSGSTGRPKGVEVSHAAVVPYVADLAAQWGLTAGDRVLQFHSLSFDVSVEELFPAWASGAAVVLEPVDRLVSPAGLSAVLAATGVTVLELPTAFWHEWVHEMTAAGGGLPEGLRLTSIAGEAVSLARFGEWVDLAGGRGGDLLHLYGVTEATVTSTLYRCPASGLPPGARTLPVGRSIAGNRHYLLDPGLRPVPAGAAGELYIGGARLARGYLGRPDLTAERFLPDPWATGGRLYRTGDRARFDAAGNLEFLGRLDRQIKLRGFRIEPGEVETVLLRHPDVREALVALDRGSQGAGEPRLVAWAAVGESPAVSADALKSYLADRLPGPMVPSALVLVDRLPRTPNGKFDRRALPPPEAPRRRGSAPAGRTEVELAAIWRDVLAVEEVGIEDNFFDLGGHSLLLARLQGEIQRRLDRSVPLLALFQHPTIRALARHLTPPRSLAPAVAAPAAIAAAAVTTPPAAAEGDPRAVAIIGMAGRFPGASSVEELWANLCGGVESIAFFSREELLAGGIAPAEVDHPLYVPAGGTLAGADLFDADFFGFTPREAEVLDPQHRLFLECAWEALENAGYRPDACPGEVGVYAGSNLNTYLVSLLSDPGLAARLHELQTTLLADKDFLPTRVSYLFNLTGPSVAVQTACSTSLAAVHVACRALRAGECTMALAGGAAVGAPLKAGYLYQEGGAFSPDGHCRAFDAKAAGIVSGQGVGVVVLKTLAAALAAGDSIVAVIRGSAMNNDGSGKIGYTAPSISGQARVVRAALADSGVDPATIGYVEAHGTGTRLGDPIEIAALAKAFREDAGHDGGEATCLIGSVKTNLGHLDSAAGVAGLIKTALVLRHGVVPPSLHFTAPNPEIDFAASPFRVATALTRLPERAGPRRAAVSSLGMGGTNVHAVLEEAPAAPRSSAEGRERHLLLLSARSAEGLTVGNRRLAEHLEAAASPPEPARICDFTDTSDISDIAFTLQVGRKPFPFRQAVVCAGREDAAEALADPARRLTSTIRADAPEPRIFFLFPGQGAQYAGMGRELYDTEAGFRETFELAAELLLPHLGADLRRLLYPPPGEEPADLTATELAQPALFAVELALASLLREWGVEPSGLLGHSLGEYVAACLAGVLSLPDAVELVALRGRLMQSLPAGGMLAVPLSEREIRASLTSDLAIAAVNAPDLCVVSGPPASVAALSAELALRGVNARPLHTSHAFHSAMMDPILQELEARLRRVTWRPPAMPYVSNLTGDWIRPAEATDPQYWVRHLRHTVRFGEGLRRILAEPDALLLEVGPGGHLGAVARQGLPGPPPLLLPCLRRARPGGKETGAAVASDAEVLLTSLGRLWLMGGSVDWEAYHRRSPRRRVPLPPVPFERRRYWLAPARSGGAPPRREEPADSPQVFAAEAAAMPLGASYPRPVLSTAFVAPLGEREERIAALWEEALGIAPVGRLDSYLELGGHSLSATRMLWRVNELFEVDIPIAQVFAAPTVAGVAALVAAARRPEGAGALAAEPSLEIDPEDLAALIADVQGRSPEEILALLAHEREDFS
jgi:amino acid adenylation domain-containing protein